ncbi:uncharacterized protein OCT59_000418 [Rhizophagus irregularis]|uniref:F-box domain-containing protein n=2 Tax=Rhizophagus irregularis TaxID=588596 RepID=U9TB18_RHIID|nr:hypothetical protein GLOIN_2v1762226 [Rhizophagus irregularis DAOM 181602=DAOM 197198]EXX64006.1 hypothetical protein RirG_146980 [Rhizophagus irregularis DAOM 197198w]POG82419.1 hypothetical protein GLOIN_2v1762226 [Rhizophagus irregularis DAOM 181602=DAOM 197198]UZN99138.1 hypothetical protein OCT59_000418 [Rhizophagus irregularis]GBC47916.1 hypothetical protein GLOIN_2v1762226 [Rhizophagus irregularis DAOM 181602=DAOM 197198]|eukprot:XP_025189285.1 hypothetical protein GLOIN_2v1762226 [Rhizophagus irregularis DAOM 181602=DAOM 197198]
MSCSKLLPGNLPELTNEIIQYLRNDYGTLHSCILVNRLWCRLAIPILWEDPFSMKHPKNYYFIEIYLHNINDDDKTKLNEYGIDSDFFPLNTLFNYPNFIKSLNTRKILVSAEKWVGTIRNLLNRKQPNNNNFKQQETNYVFPLHPFDLNLSRKIYKLLFKIFINNEANLNALEYVLNEFYDYDTVELILQNPNFISKINNLKLMKINSYLNFLSFVSNTCNSITTLHFDFIRRNIMDKTLINNNLSEIIKSQQNLQKILFEQIEFSLNYTLLSLKHSNCSNTLRSLLFFEVDFKNTNSIILYEVFELLNVLESIHILYCYFDSNFIQQIVNITKPFKLKSLFLSTTLQFDSLQLLLRKSGDYIENFGFKSLISNEMKKNLFDLTIKYCSNIKFFDLLGFNNQNIFFAFNLIERIEKNLNYLSINFCKFFNFQLSDDIELSSIILLNLGQLLPTKLEYLNLALMINSDNLKIFLKNSQNTFINKLLIRNKMSKTSENILPIIKEYIMKESRVKFLAFEEVFFIGKRKDLVFSKDDVKEFDFYDIQVINYNDLQINVGNFIKEID